MGCIGDHGTSCEAIAFSKTMPIAASGGMDAKIFIYDLKDMSIRSTVDLSEFGGITRLLFSKNDANTIICSTAAGEMHLIDQRNGQIKKTIYGHVEPVNEVIEIPRQSLIVTAGDDNLCRLFSTE